MINMFKAIFHLLRSIILFIEIAFISYVVGSSIQSTSLMVIAFVVLCGLVFLSAALTISFAWAVLGLTLFHFSMDQNLLTSMMIAVIFGIIRFGVWHARRWLHRAK